MGYEFGFARRGFEDLETVSYDDFDKYVYWSCCGWNHVEMHDAFSQLASDKILDKEASTEYAEVYLYVIPVERLEFLKRLNEQLNCQTLMTVIRALDEIGEEYSYEFVESLPPGVIAAIRLMFSLPDATFEEQAICKLLLDDFERGYMYMTEGLAKMYDDIVFDGASEVILYAS